MQISLPWVHDDIIQMQPQQHPLGVRMSRMTINLFLAGGILTNLEEFIGGNLLEFIDKFGRIYWNSPMNLDSLRSMIGMRIIKISQALIRKKKKNNKPKPLHLELHPSFKKNPTVLNPPPDKTPSAARQSRPDLAGSCRGRSTVISK